MSNNLDTPETESAKPARMTKATLVLTLIGVLMTAAIVLTVVLDLRKSSGDAGSHDDAGETPSAAKTSLLRVSNLSSGDSATAATTTTFEDVERILDTVAGVDAEGVIVTAHLNFNGGVTSGDETVQIVALDSSASQLVGLDELRDDLAYMVGGSTGEKELTVNVINKISEDGVESDSSEVISLQAAGGLDKTLTEEIAGGGPGEVVVVTLPTYWRIAETMFAAEQAEIVKKVNDRQLGFFDLVREVLVHVPDDVDADTVIDTVLKAGYGVTTPTTLTH